MDPVWISSIAAGIAALGAIVTAIATAGLWRQTSVMAAETRRMVEAAARPQVVANLRPNQWAMMYADLVISNTGNATAFDIEIGFDPPIETEDMKESGYPAPLQSISVLDPGESLSAFVGEFAPIIDTVFRVTVSWTRHPEATEREELSYSLASKHLDQISRLGSVDALTQIAEQVKKLREDWVNVASGTRKLKADIFDQSDRAHDREALERRRALAAERSKRDMAPPEA